MYAVSLRLPIRGGLTGAELDALKQRSEREILGPVLDSAPGFRAYYALRASDTEVVIFHAWDRRDQAEAASARLGELSEQVLGAYLAGPPDVRAGEVLFARAA
jgi:hypothetical protein